MRAKSFPLISLTLAGALAAAVAGFSSPSCSAEENRWGNLQYIGPDTISGIATAVAPAVVSLVSSTSTGRDSLTKLQEQAKTQQDAGKKLRRYYGMDAPTAPEVETLKMTGSGVVITPDGYILTSLHVVENAKSVNVTMQDGKSYTGDVVAKDRFSDLAVLKIPATGLPTVKFGNSDKLRLGDWAIAIGNPFGLGHTVSQGLISGLGREAKGFEKSFGARTGAVRFIQTDAPINQGSSGGPLLNLNGEVIGINAFIRDDAQNIGFSVPSNVAKDVSDKLIKGGPIAHPYIGITMKEAPAAGGGVEVSEVKFRSPAATAGILPGDVILTIDGTSATNPGDISAAVGKHTIGENLHVKVKRSGADKEFDVKIEPLPESGD